MEVLLEPKLFEKPMLIASTPDNPLRDEDCEAIRGLLQILSKGSTPPTLIVRPFA